MKRKFRTFTVMLLAFSVLLAVSCDDQPTHVHSWNDVVATIEPESDYCGWIVYSCSCGKQKAEKMDSDFQSNNPFSEGAEQHASPASAEGSQSSPGAEAGGHIPSGSGGGGGGSVTHGSGPSVAYYAVSRIGCPYVFGASGSNSFDSSGLVVWCYKFVGIILPNDIEAMYTAAKRKCAVSEARPGDVLYRPGHVGISYGGASCIHAKQETGSVVCTVDEKWTCALQFISAEL